MHTVRYSTEMSVIMCNKGKLYSMFIDVEYLYYKVA